MTAKNNLEVEGNLRRSPLAELLTEIAQLNLSGSLRLSKEQLKIIIYFDKGEIVFAVSNSRQHRLFEILLNQGQITKKHLTKIEHFTNDIYLAKTLVQQEVFKKEGINAFFAYQISKIIESALTFDEGDWTFSSLARIKEGIRFEVDINPVLYKHSQTINVQDILGRFKSFDEVFWLNPNKPKIADNFTPQEGFVLSRINDFPVSIDNLKSMSGLEHTAILQILYCLWIGGYIYRGKWNSAFNKDNVDKMNSANFTLKTSAKSVEEEQEKAEAKKVEAEANAAEAEAKKKEKEEKEKEEKVKYLALSLEEYIFRIENAATHYEIFDVVPTATIKEIKQVYFKLAKQFHPDLYHKKVDPELHAKIQHSFTEIAQAYETLKDYEAREVYDFKLRKVLEKYNQDNANSESELTKDDLEASNQATMASENFDNGYDHLMKEEYDQSLPYFGRAVSLESDNARYQAFYGKALSFDKTKRHNAESHLQTAIKLEPKNTVYRIMLVELFIAIGLNVRAKGELNRLLKIAPNNKEAESLLDSLNNK